MGVEDKTSSSQAVLNPLEALILFILGRCLTSLMIKAL